MEERKIVPAVELQNERAKWVLKPIEESMIDEMFVAIGKNSEYLTFWIPHLKGDDKTLTEQFVKTVVEQHKLFCENKPHSYYNFAIIDSQTGGIIGVIGVLRIDWIKNKAEIGYWIDKDYSSKGITTTSCIYVRDHIAFDVLHLNQIELHIMDGNIPSQRVAQKLNPSEIITTDEIVELRGIKYTKLVYIYPNPSKV
eukprot:TRINITY_DN17892_c0_g1_i1.p1 TRINITY_DN17892_c0_g1~~TRINITY_DN17892_c0_g1_i1.p1  ORF type:complete len:197 (+),score=24.92 TRINITY_DN17892_c0_g1_i1:109-699(+)